MTVIILQNLQENLAKAELRHNALRQRTEATNRLLQGDIEREKSLARSLSRNIEHLKQQKDMNERLKALKQQKVSLILARMCGMHHKNTVF